MPTDDVRLREPVQIVISIAESDEPHDCQSERMLEKKMVDVANLVSRAAEFRLYPVPQGVHQSVIDPDEVSVKAADVFADGVSAARWNAKEEDDRAGSEGQKGSDPEEGPLFGDSHKEKKQGEEEDVNERGQQDPEHVLEQSAGGQERTGSEDCQARYRPNPGLVGYRKD
jgi:hypothetical protein